VALGYDGPFSDAGAVVIIDLLKHKVLKFYATASVTSISWSHTGEHLYAGNVQYIIYKS